MLPHRKPHPLQVPAPNKDKAVKSEYMRKHAAATGINLHPKSTSMKANVCEQRDSSPATPKGCKDSKKQSCITTPDKNYNNHGRPPEKKHGRPPEKTSCDSANTTKDARSPKGRDQVEMFYIGDPCITHSYLEAAKGNLGKGHTARNHGKSEPKGKLNAAAGPMLTIPTKDGSRNGKQALQG